MHKNDALQLYTDRDFSSLYSDSEEEGLVQYITQSRDLGLYKDWAALIIDIAQPSTVLDIGCGKGDIVKLLRGVGISAWGFDASDYIQNGGCPLYIFKLDILSSVWFFKSLSFDVVCCFEVLEHFLEVDIDVVLNRLCACSKTYIIGSISETPAVEHFLLKGREWWNAKFAIRGFAVVHAKLELKGTRLFVYKRKYT